MIKVKVNKKKIKIISNLAKMYPKLENLTVTPTSEQQTFTHPNSYGYDEVVVNAVETETLNITPKEVEQNFVGLYGEVNVDKINAEEKSEELDFSNSDVIEVKPSENSYLKKVTINKDEDLLPQNIKSGVSIFGVNGTGEMLDIEINDCRYLFYTNARTNIMNDLLKLCKNVTNCTSMFAQNTKVTKIDLSNFDTSLLKEMGSMFNGCTNLQEVNLENFNTKLVTNMGSMFANCGNLVELDLSSFDFSSMPILGSMFQECRKLKKIILPKSVIKTNSCNHLFRYCNVLKEIDLDVFDLSEVTDTQYMFYYCYQLKTINFNKFNNKVIKGMYAMFTGCGAIDIDLSGFYGDVLGNITAFNNCNSLTNLVFLHDLGKGYTQKSNNYSYYKLDLHWSTKLTHDSLMDVINKLYDLNLTYDVANGGTLYTQQLVLGATNLAKLTADEIQIATNKGWTVS